jgi:hypothetical protein
MSKPLAVLFRAALKDPDAGWMHEPLEPADPSEPLTQRMNTDLERRLTDFRSWAATRDPAWLWERSREYLAQNSRGASALPASELSSETELEVASDFSLETEPRDGTIQITLKHAGKQVTFNGSKGSADLLQSLLGKERFRPSELSVSFQAARGVLRLLLDFGILRQK